MAVLAVTATAVAAITGPAVTAVADTPDVSFHKDVEPIVQKNCQTCHRPGQVAPMSFLTYESSRPWARAMKTAVASRRMPPYDFNWQLGYYTSIRVPKGTRMIMDAHFDNPVGNRSNPNPNRTVYYGSMTWEEMMNPFYGVVVDADVDPRSIVRSKHQQVEAGG